MLAHLAKAGTDRVMGRSILSCAALLLTLSTPVLAQSSLPDPARTPGAVSPAVTQDTIGQTICKPGWARTVRPPRRLTSSLKRRQLRVFGYADQHMRDYEEDHLIPLELGGAPTDERNLWPEPLHAADGWAASQKDALEDVLHKRVCLGEMPLRAAQRAMSSSWTRAWVVHFGTAAGGRQ